MFGVCKLRFPQDEEEQFEDSTFSFEQLTAIALVGRANAAMSLKSLRDAVADRTTRLQSYCRGQIRAPASEMSILQEEMFWLIRLLGHVLADSPTGSGEKAVVPRPVMALSLAFTRQQQHVQAAVADSEDPVVS